MWCLLPCVLILSYQYVYHYQQPILCNPRARSILKIFHQGFLLLLFCVLLVVCFCFFLTKIKSPGLAMNCISKKKFSYYSGAKFQQIGVKKCMNTVTVRSKMHMTVHRQSIISPNPCQFNEESLVNEYSKDVLDCSFGKKCFYTYINTTWSFLLWKNVPLSNKTTLPLTYIYTCTYIRFHGFPSIFIKHTKCCFLWSI